MGADQNIAWHALAASALEWWQDAGVDMLVDDAPRDWFAAPAPPPPAALAPASTTPVAVLEPAEMPASLAEFLTWRNSPAVPEALWGGVAFAATGPATAELMVLVDCPERDDGETLLSGPAGRLFDRMLAAIGTTREAVHLASVCAKRPTAGRVHRDVEAQLAAIAQHHVGLIAPKRLLVLGNAASRAILATDLPDARGRLHAFNHKTGKTGTVVSFHPRFLIEKPAAKPEAWRDLQMLMRNSDA
ncbi:uracil-DNA glycosylase [Sphingomonas ginsenosidivorax]|uniref:Uracil-DNA glycosylase n=1 Tax=Sphingomonas ginsenosidivorax TaxID=862135 RepID=A0A5C6UDR1_9SPHN|nr:uracil-DNA glycosylase family protein [Sphingomonas ginsenosidivorax]TXC70947.1 uracil-DNA glycosylase [Sphingomonas ginsenosidivorax]